MHLFGRMAKLGHRLAGGSRSKAICATGALFFIGNAGGSPPGNFTFNDFQIAVAPVPEPSTVAFVGLGLLIAAGISFVRRPPK
jgi:hypothetical protein